MGRNSAGEGFLRGLLAHADVDRFYLWNAFDRPQNDLEALLHRLGPPTRPLTWIGAADRGALAAPGAVHFPTPELQREAWARRTLGGTAYSLTGVTHTIAETYIMGEIAGLLLAPLEPWDALVCTSPAVQAAVQTQLEAVADHLHERLGATRIPPAQLVTIPLGVHAADFAFDPEARRAWREVLEIPLDAVAALYFGRFSIETKMNPAPMAMALQQAAERTGQAVWWILFGGSKSIDDELRFHEVVRAFCPDVNLRFVREIDPNAHGPLWSAADLFISLSDNIQESFGLTVIEAMAAGLPCVVSDWDGYRHSVRHGQDGYRIRTTLPRPGLGADIAFRYAQGLSDYKGYLSAQSQFTAVDIAEAAEALAALITDAGLRARLGSAAAERARQT
ncbi:MAG TPA: glycosyltransferase family 4 protein, partial [Phenylobacterium sp.]